MANWSLPTVGDLYTAVVSLFKDRDDALATQFDTALTASTNLPEKTKRWNSTANKWEKLAAGTWSDLSSNYSINISGNAATATQAADSMKLGGLAMSNFVRTISGSPPDAAGNVVVDMSAKLNLSGGTMSGQLTVAGAQATVYDTGGASGRVNLNSAKNRYLNYNGTSYELPGAALYVNGAAVYTTANLNISGASVNYANTAGSAPANGGTSAACSGNAASASSLQGYGAATFLQAFHSKAEYCNGVNIVHRFTRLDNTYFDTVTTIACGG